LDVEGTNNSFVKKTIVPACNTGDPAAGNTDTPRRTDR
jgi:primary-amine oxidase